MKSQFKHTRTTRKNVVCARAIFELERWHIEVLIRLHQIIHSETEFTLSSIGFSCDLVLTNEFISLPRPRNLVEYILAFLLHITGNNYDEKRRQCYKTYLRNCHIILITAFINRYYQDIFSPIITMLCSKFLRDRRVMNFLAPYRTF